MLKNQSELKQKIGKALSIIGIIEIIALIPTLFVVGLSSMTDGTLKVGLDIAQLFNSFVVTGSLALSSSSLAT
jgi:hypothetical protein